MFNVIYIHILLIFHIFYILNCTENNSFDAEGRAGTTMILRDSNGEVIFLTYRSLLNCNEASEAKICALMEGMSLALEWSTTQTDCAVAMAALKERMKNRFQYSHLIDEVYESLRF
jgi:sugar/nucleoside kinase (ribokinase family)